MTTASPDSKNAPDTAPDDMKPPLPNLLRPLPTWLRPVRKVDCAWVEERLPAYSDWDLPEDEFEAVGAHLQHCAACRQSLAETEKLLRSFRPALPSIDPAMRFPWRCAAATMAYILAAEDQPVTLASIFRSLQQRSVHVALACMALLLLSILAFVAHFSPNDIRTEPVAATPLTSEPAGADPLFAKTMVGLGTPTQLPQEFAVTLASSAAHPLIPTAQAQSEVGTRREHCTPMWFSDHLCEQYPPTPAISSLCGLSSSLLPPGGSIRFQTPPYLKGAFTDLQYAFRS